MTLLFFDAIQDTSTMRKPEWSTNAWQGGMMTGRDGQTNGAATNNNTATLTPVGVSGTTVVVGGAVFSGAYTLPNPLFVIANSSAAQVWVMLNSAGFIEVRRGGTSGTLLGTTTGHPPLINSTWRYVDVKIDLQTTATGTVKVGVDGVVVLSVTTVQTSANAGGVTSVVWPQTSGNIFPWFWDDIYLCDGVDATTPQGQPNNDLLGDVKVTVLLPSAAGDDTDWTPSTGTNFGAVDEVPPNTTDYVSTSVSADRDLYNLVNPSGTVGTVYGVQVSIYAAKTDAGAATIKPVVKQGSTVTSPSAQGLSTTFTGLCGPLMPVRPSDSAVWTASDLTSLQAGVELG